MYNTICSRGTEGYDPPWYWRSKCRPDGLVSPTSTASYGPDELKTMLELLPSNISDIPKALGQHRIMFILMKHFCEEKFANFHGVQKTCSDLTVYSTVLVALDIGIFAIQSVDAGPNTSWIKTFLYFSVVASLGSIMSAFLLQRKNQEVLQVSYVEACQLMNRFRDASGLYSL
ncbi:uncharacterized protein EV420DRAFT_1484326 [Desarmillaria tabescens]|uniref:Uncharacterized protein n=1 Tax=Armillaria tabescens TaxID=1929756 RepID=A0AA39JP42_ARMTA|nr:uncharacterized protein EV420DRAFT_1484326 [Desarmillaria tabescens]KAK0445271.1 hypothetical protein EV420DRAFT_1484326 [Desarmillaria tabescens]